MPPVAIAETISHAQRLYLRGHWSDAFAALERELAVAQNDADAARLKLALAEAYNFDLVSGLRHAHATHKLLDDVEKFAEGRGDQLLLAAALQARGMALHVEFITATGDPDRELSSFSRAADLRGRHGDRAGEAESKAYLGVFHHVDRLDRDAAQPILQEAYELAGEVDSPGARSEAARHLGQIRQELGNPAAAVPLLEESLALMKLHAPVITAFGHHALASARFEAGDRDGAQQDLVCARVLSEDYGLPLGAVFVARLEAEFEIARLAPGVSTDALSAVS